MFKKTLALTLFLIFFIVSTVFAGALFNYPKFKAFDSNGDPLSGGKLYTYIAGTTTAKTTYSDKDLSTANANPLILDSYGEGVVYGSGKYKFVLKDSDDSLLWTFDDLDSVWGYLGPNFYFADASLADQGVAVGSVTIKDFVDSIGGTAKATIALTRGNTGNHTDYIFLNSETISSNITLLIEEGARISVATGKTVTINSPFDLGFEQVFTGAGSIVFGTGSVEEVYPEWWGIDGTADNLEIQKAINSVSGLNGAVVRLLPKDYNTTATITIARDRINIWGSGIRATKIIFAPSANDVAIEWDEGGTMISQCSIRDLTIYTNDTAHSKVGMRLEDVDVFEAKNVEIHGSDTDGWTGSTGSIGIQIQGRNIGSFQNINIRADTPISIEDNPNSTLDIDHFNFHNLYLISKSDDSYPCIKVADGVNLSNVSFTGVQAWVYGSHGFYLNDTTTTSVSYSLKFENVRWEQSTAGAGHYMIYIVRNAYLQNLLVQHTKCGNAANHDNIYLRNCLNITLQNAYYGGTGTALNADSTCIDMGLENCRFQDASTVTTTGLYEIFSLVKETATAPIARYSFYTTKSNDYDFRLGYLRYYSYQASVADDGVITMTFPYAGTICQLLVAANNGAGASEGGHWIISTDDGNNQSTKVSGTANTAISDSDTDLCVYKNTGNSSFTIKNRLGNTRTVQIVLWWL